MQEVTDVGLKMAIGSTLFRENHWVADYHIATVTGKKSFSFWDDSEEPENEHSNERLAGAEEGSQDEQINWDDFYQKMFDNFSNEVTKHWSVVKDRSPALIFNPSFPATDLEEDRPESLAAVSHCICTNCGRLFDLPKESLVEHILVTGHIGWYAVCLVERQELESLVAKKTRKKRAKNKRRPVAPVFAQSTSSARR